MNRKILNWLAFALCLLALVAKAVGLDIPAFIAIFLALVAGVAGLFVGVREHGEFAVTYTDEQREKIVDMLRRGDGRAAISQTQLWSRGVTDEQAQQAVEKVAADFGIELGEAGKDRPF